MFIWVQLTGANGQEKDGNALAKRAIEQGVAFVPGTPFFAQNPDSSTLRLSFATADIPKIEEGMARLAKAF
ncbi:2-aminoadipate transaminase [compost metagenome]